MTVQPKGTGRTTSRKFYRDNQNPLVTERRRAQMKAIGEDTGHQWKLKHQKGS